MAYPKKTAVTSNMEIIDKVIIDIVENKGGCKLMDLIVGLSDVVRNQNLTNIKFDKFDDLHKLIILVQQSTDVLTNTIFDKVIQLIKTGRLVGISYTLQNQSFSEKMFILPKGTSFKYILKNKEG